MVIALRASSPPSATERARAGLAYTGTRGKAPCPTTWSQWLWVKTSASTVAPRGTRPASSRSSRGKKPGSTTRQLPPLHRTVLVICQIPLVLTVT